MCHKNSLTETKRKDTITLMKKKLFLGLAIATFLGLAEGYSQETPLEPGSFSVGGRLLFDFYSHKLGDSWTSFKTGYKGINYNFASTTSTTAASWENVSGQLLFMDVGFRPTENLSGNVTLEYINNYADRYWMPVNFEHRQTVNDQRFSFNKADITYSRSSWSLRYARNIAHVGWSGRGDLFDLYPDQTEPDRYLRIAGEPAPEWWQFDVSGRAGKLELIYGSQAIWDYRNGIYANYNFNLLGANYFLIYRDHVIPYGTLDERMKTIELSSMFDLGKNTLQIGFMYQPFRLGWDYTYVEEVAPGTGLLGSKYVKKTGQTTEADAVGASTKMTFKPYPVLNEWILQYTYQGLSAGNKQEFDTQMSRRLSRFMNGTVEFTARKPLIGPLPMVYEGTPGNTGPALLQPRGPESPFWVGWENKVTGWENREANIFSFTLNVDPTPDTWFYLWRPNVMEEWNLNPDENSTVSFAARYQMANYPTSTDRLVFWNNEGKVMWEYPMLTAPWSTDGYVGSFSLLSKILLGDWKFLLDAGTGQQLAWGCFAYTTSTAQQKPITNYVTTGLVTANGPYTLRLRYGQDIFGPEEWHRQLGETFDRLYMASLSRKIGGDLLIGVDYVGTREVDGLYLSPDLGNYDEYHAYLTLSFGPLVPYFGSKPQAALSYGEAPEVDVVPPTVSVVLSTTTFSPAVSDLAIEPWASDFSGIAKWKIVITDAKDRTVKTLSGDGQPPYTVKWNGRDDLYDMTVPDGAYQLTLTAEDEAGNAATTDSVRFTVQNPPKKAEVPQPPKEMAVVETEQGLKVTFSAQVLFDKGKHQLKPASVKALNELVKLLNQYSLNKVSVEGYTDSQGSTAYNQALSERRAWSVAQYLIKAGIKAERIKVTGYGKERPIASNLTETGRQTNRRVEVIILK